VANARTHARLATACGGLAVLAIPAAVVVADRVQRVDLVRAVIVAVPLAFVVGLLGVASARKARYALARTLIDDARRLARIGRTLAWAGVFLITMGVLLLNILARVFFRDEPQR
jgi:hypothetical protein